jgi:CRP/FNR family transcriptional regulator
VPAPYDNAISAGFWAKVPREIVDKLFPEGAPAEVPSGLIVPTDDADGKIALVMSGFLRMFARAKSGRQLTISYAREGDTIGLTSALSGQCGTGLQALATSKLWVIDAAVLRRHALADARLSMALAIEASQRTYDVIEELAENVFGTVKQRVARHLLDLVVTDSEAGQLVAPISQQELANAVGTVREVVSRVLLQFRNEGVLRATPSGVEVLDATKLYDQSQVMD